MRSMGIGSKAFFQSKTRAFRALYAHWEKAVLLEDVLGSGVAGFRFSLDGLNAGLRQRHWHSARTASVAKPRPRKGLSSP